MNRRLIFGAIMGLLAYPFIKRKPEPEHKQDVLTILTDVMWEVHDDGTCNLLCSKAQITLPPGAVVTMACGAKVRDKVVAWSADSTSKDH